MPKACANSGSSIATRPIRSRQIRISAASSAVARSATWPRKIEPTALPIMKASRGAPAADGDMLKTCATMGMPHTPDNVVTTAKCDAKVIAHPQFAVRDRACQAAERTLANVLLLLATGAGFNVTAAKARLAAPTQAMKMKQARQPKP